MAKTRAINLFLDEESLEAVDGDIGVQELLQVKLDPTGGLAKGPSGLGVATAIAAPPGEGLTFAYDLVDPGLSSQAIYPVGGNVVEVPITYDGILYGLSVRLSGLPSAGGSGCIVVKPTINGIALAAATFDCSFDSGSPTQQEYKVDLTGSETFSEGDRLGLVITTSGSLAPSNLNLVADLVIIGS